MPCTASKTTLIACFITIRESTVLLTKEGFFLNEQTQELKELRHIEAENVVSLKPSKLNNNMIHVYT